MSYVKTREAAERLGFTETELTRWSKELGKYGFIFLINNQGAYEYCEEDLEIFSDCYQFFDINRIDTQINRLKRIYPKRFSNRSVVNLPSETETNRVNEILKKKETLGDIPATERQLFALHLASNRTIDTRGLKIDKKTAGTLIGRSKNGENINEALLHIIQKNSFSSNNPKQKTTYFEIKLKEMEERVLFLENELETRKKKEKELFAILLDFLKN